MRDPIRAVMRAWPLYRRPFRLARLRSSHYAARRVPVQRRPCVHQGDGEIRAAGQAVLRQADQLRAAQEQRVGPRRTTSPTRTRACRWTTPSRPRRTCRRFRRRRRSSTRRSCSAISRTGTRCSCRTLSGSLMKFGQADVMLIGFAGGGTRQISPNKPVRNMAEMKGLRFGVQGAPIGNKTFAAVGMAPTVIRTTRCTTPSRTASSTPGRTSRGRRADEVLRSGPPLTMTQHAITIRPLAFSGKTFKNLPADLQAAILRAARKRASTAVRSSRARTRQSSMRWKRPAS